MRISPFSWAAVCHRFAPRGIAIAIALVGCGGAVTSPATDGGAFDAPIAPSSGCPDVRDIDSDAALGKVCAPEGTYCLNPACDPCTKSCPAVACTGGTWTRAVNTAICTGTPDASPGVDSGAPPDAAACVDFGPAGYDQTCNADSDCVAVAAGTLCSGGPWCLCAAAAINVVDQTRYAAALQDLESHVTRGTGGCNCPAFGAPRCLGNRCILCGGASGNAPGCPDGG